MANRVTLSELNSFITNPAAYLEAPGDSLDARISALSETIKAEPSLLTPISQDFLGKIEHLSPEQKSKAEPLSLQLFLQSFGLKIEGENHHLWEALLLLPITAREDPATLQSVISCFNGVTNASEQAEIVRAIWTIPERDRVAVLERAPPLLVDITGARQRFEIIRTIWVIPEGDRVAVLALASPLLVGITDGYHRAEIINAIHQTPEKERDAVLAFASPLLVGITDGHHRAEIINAIRQIPEKERVAVLALASPLLTGITDGEKRTQIISAISYIPDSGREATLPIILSLFNVSPDHSKRYSILNAIKQIPERERVAILELASPFLIGITDGSHCAEIISAIRRIPEKERAADIDFTRPFLANITDGYQRLDIVLAIKKIPVNEREATLPLIISLFNGISEPAQRSSILKAIERISADKRVAALELARPFLADITNGQQRANLIGAIRQTLPEKPVALADLSNFVKTLKEQRLWTNALQILTSPQGFNWPFVELLIEHESAAERTLLIDLFPYINSLLKEGRKDLITSLLTGDFFQKKELFQKVLQNETASHYFLKVNPQFFASKIKEMGGFEKLQAQDKIAFLPILPPDMIKEAIVTVDPAAHMNIEVEFGGLTDSLQKMLDYVYTQRVLLLKWEGQDDTAFIIEIGSFLDKIPFTSLAVAAKQEPIVLAYLQAMSDLQLAVVIPQIDPDALVAHFEKIKVPLHTAVNYNRVANFLHFATVEQKKAFFIQLQKDVPNLDDFTLNMLHAAVVYLRRALKEGTEDPTFSNNVDLFFSTLRKPATVVLPEIEDIPDEFRCPISLRLMEDPVIVQPSGKIYDRFSIETWLSSPGVPYVDPFTKQEITSIKPAVELKAQIDAWNQTKQQST